MSELTSLHAWSWRRRTQFSSLSELHHAPGRTISTIFALYSANSMPTPSTLFSAPGGKQTNRYFAPTARLTAHPRTCCIIVDHCMSAASASFSTGCRPAFSPRRPTWIGVISFDGHAPCKNEHIDPLPWLSSGVEFLDFNFGRQQEVRSFSFLSSRLFSCSKNIYRRPRVDWMAVASMLYFGRRPTQRGRRIPHPLAAGESRGHRLLAPLEPVVYRDYPGVTMIAESPPA